MKSISTLTQGWAEAAVRATLGAVLLAAWRTYLEARADDIDYQIRHANEYPDTSSLDVVRAMRRRDDYRDQLRRLPPSCLQAWLSADRMVLVAACAAAGYVLTTQVGWA